MNEESLFAAALGKQNAAERQAFLEEACAGDVALRQRVEQLLAADQHTRGILERGPDTAALNPLQPEPPLAAGRVFAGRYKLLEQIGEGGMGSVWMAQQAEPVKRLVAIKLIKPGMDSKQVLARFEAERQVLALMDHPNIAKVLDGGAAPDGRPFFVMDLVKGVPITKYCDEHHLTPRQRLELFVPVCQAIQHAHHKGIIHRDIKPSNVLVALYDDRPVPKVIDFGVAKATGQQLTEQTLHTGFGAVVGTVEYMSPEQASFNQLDVDTRSDIYSLGVLLYELLTGSPPFSRKELENAGVLEMLRVIREQEPPRPSTKLSTAKGLPTLAANRGTEPKRLTALVRGELDWIVMKALDKDRNRRYETAKGLAMDLQRYLADRPILARRTTLPERARRWCRRNAALASVLTLLAMVLLFTAVGGVLAAVRFRGLADQANEARKKEEEGRRSAEDMAEERRQKGYALSINLAQQAWEAGDVGRMRDLLDSLRPGPGEEDLRGFEWHYLRGLCHGERLTLRGHEGAVLALAYAPDGKIIASAGSDGDVRLWDAATGGMHRRFKAHDAWVHGLAFAPHGKLLASASADGTVKLWDAATGQRLAVLRGHSDRVYAVAFAPDSKLVATGGADRTIRLWDAATGKDLTPMPPQKYPVFSVAFSPDGKTLASGSADLGSDPSGNPLEQVLCPCRHGGVRLWDVATREERAGFPNRDEGIFLVAFSPSGPSLASVSGDQTATLWDVAKPEVRTQLRGRNGPLYSIAFAPDGWTVAAAGRGQIVRLWGSGGNEVGCIRGHTGAVWCVRFSPDGQTIATGSGDGSVKLWDRRDQCQEYDFLRLNENRDPRGDALSPDGRLCAGVSISTEERLRSVRLCQVATGAEVAVLDELNVHPLRMAFTPDGKTLAAIDSKGHAHLVNVATRKVRVSWQAHVPDGTNPCLALSPDGKLLATGHDLDVKLWDVATGKEAGGLESRFRVTFLTFSSDGGTLLVGDESSHREGLLLWDVASRQGQRLVTGHTKPIDWAAFSPDGRTPPPAAGTARFGSRTRPAGAKPPAFAATSTPSFTAASPPMARRWPRRAPTVP